MKSLRPYQIPFTGLKNGLHQFNFEIDGHFFENFEDSLVSDGLINVKLEFDKKDSFILLNFIIHGKVKLPCNRCQVVLDFEINGDYPIVVKFDEHDDNANDDSNADVIYISRNDDHLDVSQLIYEFIALSIPMHRINCDNFIELKPCNFELLKKLNSLTEDQIKEEQSDPRWDKLKNLKLK